MQQHALTQHLRVTIELCSAVHRACTSGEQIIYSTIILRLLNRKTLPLKTRLKNNVD